MSEESKREHGTTQSMNDASSRDEAQRRGIRRTALLLGGVAVLFYLGFIAMNAFFR